MNEEPPAVIQDSPVNNDPPKSDRIYAYFKKFAINNGVVNGDYSAYSKPANNYGGYSGEDFSLSYWGNTDTVEFCLHSVLNETFSINFYLRIPKEYTGEYTYISSYYYRSNGSPLYEAKGTIRHSESFVTYILEKYPSLGRKVAAKVIHARPPLRCGETCEIIKYAPRVPIQTKKKPCSRKGGALSSGSCSQHPYRRRSALRNGGGGRSASSRTKPGLLFTLCGFLSPGCRTPQGGFGTYLCAVGRLPSAALS